jgi:hypothetical protein
MKNICATLLSCLVLAFAGNASALSAEPSLVPGKVLVASCGGLSKWNPVGDLGFARIFVPETPSAGSEASVVAWGDMIYDGCHLASGNHPCSAHEWVREIDPDGAIVWELEPRDIREFPVLIFGGFHRCQSGNALVANSDWHYREAQETAVQPFEGTQDKRGVWKLGVERFAGGKPGSLEPKTGRVEQRIIGIQWLEEAQK